ncbi:MAG: SDR family NAD(P)-dependent oxidoreductase [Candidatus Riflebacteria bacterium]|nr:SDR family NAD(P)-dependent oxidoreductase [Candidatus Riflebacteria bacterium]
MKLREKRILVVGVSRGIGKELALQLGELDNRLVLFSRNVDELCKDTRFQKLKHPPLLCRGDIRNTNDIESLVKSISDADASGIDGVIICTGVSRPDYIDNPDPERAIDNIRVNLEGPLRVIYMLLPLILRRRGSFIAAFTSMAGDRGMPIGHSYSASKAGLDRLLDSLRIDLYDRNVSVYTIVPGYVKTPMSDQNHFPMPGIWPVEKAGRHIIKLMEKERLIIRFPWYHDLGMKILGLLPNFVYWRLMNYSKKDIKIVPQADDKFQWKNEY